MPLFRTLKWDHVTHAVGQGVLLRDLQHNGISFVSTICLRHFCLSLTPNIDVPPCWRGNCPFFDNNFVPWISLFKILHFSNPKEIARIEKRAQGIGARPFSLVGIIYPTAPVAGLRFDTYKVNSLECLTLWMFFPQNILQYFQNDLNMVPALL